MRIPESIIQAAEWGLGENFNHVILKCGQDKREEIGELFKEYFVKNIIEEMIQTVDEYEDCIGLYSEPEYKCVSADEDDMDDEAIEHEGYYWGFEPTEFDEYDVETEDIDEGILVEYPILVFMCGMGDCYAGASNAVKKALEQIIEEYPECSYAGYEAYFWSDVRSGESEQRKITSEEEQEIYEFVGKKLNMVMSSDEFWEQLEEYDWEDELEEINEFMDLYQEYLDEECFERMSEMSE